MAKAKPKFKFSKVFQAKLVRLLYQFPEASQDILQRLDSTQFDTVPMRWTVNKLQRLNGQHGVPATFVMLKHEIRKDIRAGLISDAYVADHKFLDGLSRKVPDKSYILDEAHNFIRYLSLRQFVVSAGRELQKPDINWDAVRVGLNDQVQIGERSEGTLGQDFFDDLPARIKRRKDFDVEGVPTGLPIDNKFRHGGLPPRQLGVFMAPPGRGKTAVLVFVSGSGILAGKNVLFVSTELDEDMIGERHDARFSGISISKLNKKPKTLKQRLRAIANNGAGQLRIKFFPPNALTVAGLKLYLKRLEATAFYPDLIVIDYADNMSLSEFGGSNADSDYGPLGRLYIGLRGLAGEFNVPIWTASQTNRAATDKKRIGMQDLADSFRKAAVADVLIAIAQTTKERTRRAARLLICKNRNGPVAEDGLAIRFEPARVRIS